MNQPPKHPAKFSREVLDALFKQMGQEVVRRYGHLNQENWPHRPLKVLDPFAGIGGIHSTRTIWWETYGVEIEYEWAAARPGTIVGDATALPYADGTFDLVVTSPCYGNRMADTYDGKGVCRACNGDGAIYPSVDPCERCGGTGQDQSSRHTYRLDLGRMPTAGSSAVMQWGRDYRMLHIAAWREALRVIQPEGLLLVNVSDHIRQGKVVRVSDWHRSVLKVLGATVEDQIPVYTRRMRKGANHRARVECEQLIVARKPAAA